MTIADFMQQFSLYAAIVNSWNWAESHRLVLELDLSNLNQPDYEENEQQDFRAIMLIFEHCTIIDELNEGFVGFSHGDARIIEASEIKKEALHYSQDGIKLVMMHDSYDGSEEKLISIVLLADKISIIDSKLA